MKKLFTFVAMLVAMLVSGQTFANNDWYVSLGAGRMIVSGIPTSSLVKQLDKAGVSYTSTLENKSMYQSFSIGKCANEHVCFEIGRIDGAEFSNTIVVNSADIGTLSYGGYSYYAGTQAVNVAVLQKATVSATQLSVIGKLPVTKWLDVFTRIGAYNYRLDLETSFPVYQDKDHVIKLSEKTTDHGLFPVASIGMHVMPYKDWVIGAEYQKTGKLAVISGTISYKF